MSDPPTRTYVWTTPLRLILLVIAIILFVLAAFSVSVPVNLVDLGLAVFAAAFLVP